MKIAVFGSWNQSNEEWHFRNNEELFRKACVSLGRKIAKHGHHLIVSGDHITTADRWMVEGIIEASKEKMTTNIPQVEVVERAGKRFFRGNFTKNYPKLFTYHRKRNSWWEGIYLSSIREANVILTIGGRKGTYLAGIVSIIANKKLVPIGSFGGASEKLLDILEEKEINNEVKNEIRTLRGDWTDFVLETAIKRMQISSYPKILIIHGRSCDWKDLKHFIQKKLGLSEPIIMEQVFGEGKTLPEKFECLASQVDACIAVATPDDMGALSVDDKLKERARQNVWLETGWFWGVLGRNRIMILRKGNIEMPSDLQGIEVYQYTRKPSERDEQIRQFIQKIRGV
jgi:predicted nucleotide-binding protein